MNFKHTYPPALSTERLELLRDTTVDWSLSHGLVIRPVQQDFANNASAIHAPVTLFPSPFPREEYKKAQRLQPLWNELIHRISEDAEFLKEIMDTLSMVDDFTNHLYIIYQDAQCAGRTQPLSLGLHRNDYLLHQPDPETNPIIQQVEFNTISSSFGSLSSLTADLHCHLRASLPGIYPTLSDADLPRSDSIYSLARGLARAWEAYCNPTSIVMLVVQQRERNAFDQRWLEYSLLERHGVRLIRRTLAEIATEGTHLVGSSRRELVVSGHEIAVVYFRAGYGPGDYPTEAEWSARALIEQSAAIKAPSIAYQLVGTKKVQQVLARPGVLERFLPKELDKIALLRESFTGLYPLDGSDEGRRARDEALRSPERFVMKPQREGGGNNVYGMDIVETLGRLSADEANAYILMDLIRAPQHKNWLLREGAVIEGEVVSELGIYGIYLTDGTITYLNEAAGHLLRTKSSESNEGGVAAGFAVIDSPLLV